MLLASSAFQSTCPLRGTTPAGRAAARSALQLQSTCPLRGTTAQQLGDLPARRISIHVPLAGHDPRPQRADPQRLQISIHVPLAGHDRTQIDAFRRAGIFQSTCPLRGTTGGRPCRSGRRSHFNPRAPCGARPFLGLGDLADSLISIHVPLAGHDQTSTCSSRCCAPYFNPRAPCGARPLRGELRVQGLAISIHVPLAGHDLHGTQHQSHPRISIHVPLAGHDRLPRSAASTTAYFNPRAPCGARPDGVQHLAPRIAEFQSTCPLRGTTRQERALKSGRRSYFNPRAPCGARPTLSNPITINGKFQSTCPLRGTTGEHQLLGEQAVISIHVPLAGHDPTEPANGNSDRHFNPRAPCGARPRRGRPPGLPGQNFNPRAPCGARPEGGAVPDESILEFQSTCPLRGTTRRPANTVHHHPRFQSTCPLRGTTISSHTSRS